MDVGCVGRGSVGLCLCCTCGDAGLWRELYVLCGLCLVCMYVGFNGIGVVLSSSQLLRWSWVRIHVF